MAQSREFQCKGKSFRLTLFDDGVIGIFDGAGKLFLGWPETTVFDAERVMATSDNEVCERLSQLRRL
jgi:hypothetical protein